MFCKKQHKYRNLDRPIDLCLLISGKSDISEVTLRVTFPDENKFSSDFFQKGEITFNRSNKGFFLVERSVEDEVLKSTLALVIDYVRGFELEGKATKNNHFIMASLLLISDIDFARKIWSVNKKNARPR